MPCQQIIVLFKNLNQAVTSHAAATDRLSDLAGIGDHARFTQALADAKRARDVIADAQRLYDEHGAEHGC